MTDKREKPPWVERAAFKLGSSIRWAVGRWTSVLLLAAVVASTGYAGHGYLTWRQYQIDHTYERKRATEEDANQSSQEGRAKCVQVAGTETLDCVIDAEGSQQPSQTEEADLKAQQDMAEWTYALLIVGGLGLAASIIGIAFVYANLVATRQIGENQTKAYVHATSAKLFLTSPAGLLSRMDHGVTVWVANVGQTPATRLMAVARLSVGAGTLGGESIKLENASESSTSVVLPETPVPVQFSIPRDYIESVERPLKIDPDTEMYPAIKRVECAGSIYYSDVFGKRYRTDFIFWFEGFMTSEAHVMFASDDRLTMFKNVPDRINTSKTE